MTGASFGMKNAGNDGDILEWIGVYDADGGVLGELKYVFGTIFAGRSCSLCSITHGLVREKPTFKALKHTLDIPLTLVHLNEQSEALRAWTDGQAPCVVGRSSSGFVMVFTSETLVEMAGDEKAFFEVLSTWHEQWRSRC